MSDYTITIDEGQRQVLLMALAHLAAERPGWHPVCIKPIAQKMDNPDPDSMYEEFRELHSHSMAAPSERRLKQWIDDLQSGMYINCVYCGHRYGPKDEVPATMADVLKEHIVQCPAHPMSHLLKACRSAEEVLTAVRLTWDGHPEAAEKLDGILGEIRSAVAMSL